MTHSWLVVLTCAAAASAVSYGDYSGVKMPQYGGSADYDGSRDPVSSQLSDDYHRNIPDVPASLDYKYEEEPQGSKTEKPAQDSEDPDMWRKSGRKQRDSMRPTESDNNEVHKYERDDEEIPTLRTNRRFSKHRPRLKSEIDQREEDTPPRRHNKYSRDRKDFSDVDRKDYFNIDKDYVPDDKNKEFDEDEKFVREVTTRKLNRRKPRDRLDESIITRRRNLLEEYQEELEARRHLKNELRKDEKDESRGVERPRPTEPRIFPPHRTRPLVASDDEEEGGEGPVKKQKPYDEYDDYYDMKRVHNMKNKLPELLRRTSVSFYPVRTNNNLLDMLLTNRRVMGATSGASQDRLMETQSTTSSAVPNVADSPTTESITSTSTTTTVPTSTSSTTLVTLPSKAPANISRELSLAEKSRLSIMKKAQRKEGLGFHSTKKPPVLLQVTSQMPTVVMVEPPTPAPPFMRAREFDEDTPERIEMVKRLMRHKLVAEAKSIHDLTDNWDDMVCDYIDTSLLENGAVSLVGDIWIYVLLIFVYICV